MQRLDTATGKIQALKKTVSVVVSVVLVILAGHSQAFAYLDLGTGSFILQAILAGLAAAWLTCSMYWQRIKNLFQKKTPDAEPSSTTEKSEQRDSQ